MNLKVQMSQADCFTHRQNRAGNVPPEYSIASIPTGTVGGQVGQQVSSLHPGQQAKCSLAQIIIRSRNGH